MRILVYGGTGSQGGAVVRQALKRGHTPVILTRSPEKAAPMVAMGAETFIGDLENPDSLRAASEAVDAIALMIPAFIPDPRQAPVYAQRAFAAAAAAGKMVAYNTSGPVLPRRVNFPMYDMRIDLIEMLKASGAPSVIIQPTAYLENLLGPWTRPNIVQRDVLSYPVERDQRLGWIATEDVGAFMVAALERPELTGSHFIVSGAENVNGDELAAAFSQGLGRPISYYAMSLDEFAAALDAMFGPGAGEGGKAGYAFQRENPDLIPMWTDMRPVMEKLPIEMTSIAQWASQMQQAFAKDAPLGMPQF